MASIIPGITEENWQEIESKISSLANLVEWVHIDVSDGLFTSNKIWNKPDDLNNLKTNINIAVHLMINNPGDVIDKWIASPAGSIILHWESFVKGAARVDFAKELINKVKSFGKQIGIAFKLGTQWQEAKDIIPMLDEVLILAVVPGYSGGSFKEEAMDSIKSLRSAWPNLDIVADGGLTPARIKGLIEAGANRFVSTSYIFSNNPEDAINEYKKEISRYSHS